MKRIVHNFIALVGLQLCLGCLTLAEAPPNSSPDQFSFVWISDTQEIAEKPSLAKHIPDIFQWIVRSKEDYGTIGVFHTGDIVENGWNDRYRENMNAGINLLPQGLPFIASAGNHDVARKFISYEPWLKQDFVKKTRPESSI